MNTLSSDIETRRAQLRADLEGSQREFHALIGSISEQGWTAPSHNPGWTNGQLLFHILLGFILVRPLADLLMVFGHLPHVCSKVFAGILNFPHRSLTGSMRSARGWAPGCLEVAGSYAHLTRCTELSLRVSIACGPVIET